MRRLRTIGRAAVLLLVLGLAVGTGVVGNGSPAEAAGAHAQIDGSGSSWSSNAVDQWIADASNQGLQIVYTASGSAQGRKDFAYKNVDYAVSDIAYQGTDPNTGEVDASARPYAYLPIVAGGTSFPYQIRVGGQLVRNLRLSGSSLAKIFTNQITNWNDPAITADNNGRQLPSLPIIPIVHSEGSGSTAQFTAYLAKQYPGDWGSYTKSAPRMTEYFPRKGKMVAQNGSDGVMNYAVSPASNGAIGYDEYAYPNNAEYPVAKIGNTAGYFTQPDKYNVAVSLTQAVIDSNPASPTYLMQSLDNVYVYNDPRTYPLSSYSYMVLPTGTNAQDPRMSTAKRQTLADFLYYAICSGQSTVGDTGYSPLPFNLVKAGFEQVQKLKAAENGVNTDRKDVSTCDNPTFNPSNPADNRLASTAPPPAACDKVGAGPCAAGTGANGSAGAPGTTGGGGGGGGGGRGGGGGDPSGGGSGGSAGAAPRVDPDTGRVIGADAAGGGTATGTGGSAENVASELAAARSSGMTGVLGPLAALEMVAVLVVPVLLNQRFARRRRRTR